MNFIFISPNFPHTYWQFCDRLKRNGVNVLGSATRHTTRWRSRSETR